MKQHDAPEPHWSMPIAVAEVPETGKHVELVADRATRGLIAKALGLVALPRLEATFDLTRHGDGGVRVVGRLSATVGQTCVVTLEPIENAIEESIDLLFAPEPAVLAGSRGASSTLPSEEPAESLRDGYLDLGAVALEFLVLGIDPYPRKPGARFDAATDVGDAEAHPFAALGALKKQLADKEG